MSEILGFGIFGITFVISAFFFSRNSQHDADVNNPHVKQTTLSNIGEIHNSDY